MLAPAQFGMYWANQATGGGSVTRNCSVAAGLQKRSAHRP